MWRAARLINTRYYVKSRAAYPHPLLCEEPCGLSTPVIMWRAARLIHTRYYVKSRAAYPHPLLCSCHQTNKLYHGVILPLWHANPDIADGWEGCESVINLPRWPASTLTGKSNSSKALAFRSKFLSTTSPEITQIYIKVRDSCYNGGMCSSAKK